MSGESIQVPGRVVRNLRMALKKPPNRAVQDVLVEEFQVLGDLIEIKITKAGRRFDVLLDTTHPAEAGESVNQRTLRSCDFERDPLAVQRCDSELELPRLYQRCRMSERRPLRSVEPDDSTRTGRKVGKLVKDALRGAEQVKCSVVGEDRVGPKCCGDQVGIRLKAWRARAKRNHGIHTTSDSTKASGAEVIARTRRGAAQRPRSPLGFGPLIECENGTTGEELSRREPGTIVSRLARQCHNS
jgi:hypothetical protein